VFKNKIKNYEDYFALKLPFLQKKSTSTMIYNDCGNNQLNNTGNLPVTGLFFSSSGIVHPNYTEILLPDMQDEVMNNMTRLDFYLVVDQGSNYRRFQRQKNS
jgi:hypothetical protein